jgi:hypothetical protein
MAVAKAFFDFNLISGRDVKFTNLSENATDIIWDFGDGTNTDTSNTPTHTYTADGSYLVSLKANGLTNSDILAVRLVIVDGAVALSIEDLVNLQFEPGYLLDRFWVGQEIKKWQTYLQPLVTIPFEVAYEDRFDQTKWPTIINYIISLIVVYSQLEKGLRGAFASGKGPLKQITTGPSDAQWYDNTEISKIILTNTSGTLGSFTSELCALAYNAALVLPMCPLPTGPGFIVGKLPNCYPDIWPISKA